MVIALVAAGCATDVDPELTLLPADSTVPPTTDPAPPDEPEEGAEADQPPPTTTTEPVPTTIAPVIEQRVGNPLRAVTAAGDVLGSRSDNIITFEAIPYGEAPTAQRRFEPPVTDLVFEGDFDASTPGSSCPQNDTHVSVQFFPAPAFAEDCLTLDVFTPAAGDDLPVMVWFHGGDFVSGSAHTDAYDGANLARRDVVVVNVNYRIDALGFLVTEDMARDAAGEPFGNRGLQDQIAALGWIQQNIRDFGGDPANVTIFGQGSGARSVCGHLASPMSAGLFSKAILHSGGACDSILTIEEAIDRGEQWLAETSCAEAGEVVGCLQFLGIDDLLAASEQSGVTFDLVADGVLLDRSAFSLASSDELGSVPLLIGSTLDEGTLFVVGADEPTDQELRDLVLVELEGNTDLLLSQYEAIETNLAKQATFLTDSRFACASDRLASAAGDEAVVHTYQFVHRSTDMLPELGATHGSDLILLFGNPQAVEGLDLDELNADDQLVADFLATAWTTFAAEGTPGAGTDWPPYLDSSPAHLLIGAENTVSATVQDGRCEILSAR